MPSQHEQHRTLELSTSNSRTPQHLEEELIENIPAIQCGIAGKNDEVLYRGNRLSRFWARFFFVVFLNLWPHLAFAEDAPSRHSIAIKVAPEVSVRVADSNIKVVIRLAPHTHATVWSSDQCDQPSGRTVQLSKSGTYLISPADIEAKAPTRVCVLSSDGAISTSAEFPQLGRSR
jgi:hypothetical protein